METEALTRGSDGYMHIGGTASLFHPPVHVADVAIPVWSLDARNPPPSGRIPEPDDIIGSVYVQGGKVCPSPTSSPVLHPVTDTSALLDHARDI